jgi:predicted acetyltransferase
MRPRVTLAEVPASRRVVLDNLMQLYLHDFSEFAAIGSQCGEVAADGRFPYRWLDSFWQEAERVPLLVLVDERVAGFVLVNRWSALDRPLDHSVAEFFILRKYRRAGIGRSVAGLVFARYPGRWEVPVADYNRSALLFWPKAIAGAVAGPVEAHPGDGSRWAGTVFCFVSGQSR